MESEKKGIKIIPVGGCGEIGMNMTLYQSEKVVIAVDCGVLFPDASLSGVDFLIPDISQILNLGYSISAWVFTHAHEDHIGAFPYLYPFVKAPVYASALTMAFLQSKCQEHQIKIEESYIVENNTQINIHDVSFTFLSLSHSVPDAMGILFQTSYGNILHTGDFRLSPTSMNDTLDIDATQKNLLSHGKIDLLLSDSTNAMVQEADVDESFLVPEFETIMDKTEGRVIIASFASSIWRFETILQAAQQSRRKVAFLGRGPERNYAIAQSLGILGDFKDIVLPFEEIIKLPPQEICVFCAGSQGEINAGFSRIARGHVSQLKLHEKDTVILSARTIPGNEKNINYVLNHLARTGCRIITSQERKIHTSGHGSKEELEWLIEMVKPRYLIPIHGEYRHLKTHQEIAQNMQVQSLLMENNDIILFSHENIEKIGELTLEKAFLYEKNILTRPVYKEKQEVGKTGVLFLTLLSQNHNIETYFETVGLPDESWDWIPPLCQRIYQEILEAERSLERFFEEECRIQIRREYEIKRNFKPIVKTIWIKK